MKSEGQDVAGFGAGEPDFRLEVTPAEIYVRRVTVTREDAQSSPPQPRP